MNPIRALARPMLASTFVMEGVDDLRDPGPKIAQAEQVRDALAPRLPQAQGWDGEQMVKATGAVKVAGGALLALGKLPRLAAAALAATFVPTTLANNRFWEQTDPEARANQQSHFLKDVGLLGGLLITAMDTRGRPGLAWRAEHAAERAEHAIERGRREAKLAGKLAKAEAARLRSEARRGAEKATGHSRREAKLARKLARERARRAGADARRGVERAKRRATPDVTDLASGVRKLRDRD